MPKLPEKYKGQSFADISEDIQSKYENRFDPISQRGLESQMTMIREEQEYQKAKRQIKQDLTQIMQAPPVEQQEVQPVALGSNEGVVPQLPQGQDQGNFQHAASQSYNEQFANGGVLPNTKGWLDWSQLNAGVDAAINPPMIPQTTSGVPAQGNNILRYAPLAGNIFNLLSARKAPPIQSGMGRTSIDESLATDVAPRQTQFSNVDFSPIERGINQQARGFTGQNLNVSGGNAGAFLSNELGNQSNVMDAISKARMAQQQGDQQTQLLNAQEQARIDQFKQGQNQTRASIQGQNMGIDLQLADMNARNLGAFNSAKSANINALFSNLGSIGKEADMAKMISSAMGYNQFGQYIDNIKDPKKKKGLIEAFKNIISATGQ